MSPYLATRQLVFNLHRSPLGDIHLRQAILHALEREKLPALLRNGERPVTGLIPPGLAGYRDLPLVTRDLARALEERKPLANGKAAAGALTLEIVFHNLDTDRRVAHWLLDQLGAVNVKLKLSPKSAEAYLEAIRTGSYDLALETWNFGISSPADILQAFTTGARQNHGGFTSVTYDDWIQKLLSRPKPEIAESSGWIDQATRILEAQEVGVIPLGYPTQPFLLGRRVVGFAITAYGDPDLVRIQLKH